MDKAAHSKDCEAQEKGENVWNELSGECSDVTGAHSNTQWKDNEIQEIQSRMGNFIWICCKFQCNWQRPIYVSKPK